MKMRTRTTLMNLQFYLLTSVLFYSSPAFAESSLGTHEHGHVELNVAVDGKNLFVEVHSPSQSFLGFEHRPETDQEKSLWTSVKNQWENKTSELIQIDPSLNCKFGQAHMDIHFEEEHHHDEGEHHEIESLSQGDEEHLMGMHSEIKAEATFLCREEINNSQLVVWLKKYFKNIEEIEAQVLPNSGVPYSKILTHRKAILDL